MPISLQPLRLQSSLPALLLFVLGLLLLPGTASAAVPTGDFTYDAPSHALSYTAMDHIENVVAIARTSTTIAISDSAGSGPNDPGATIPGCTYVVATKTLTCVLSTASIDQLYINLGDLDDTATATSTESYDPLSFHWSGGAGTDHITGSSEADTYVEESGSGTDTYVDTGHSGGVDDQVDTIDYSPRATGVTVIADGTAASGGPGENDTVPTSIEHIVGSSAADVLTGNALPNTIEGHDGLDAISGGDGPDFLIAGAGGGPVSGGDGNDVVAGGAGVDTIDGGPGDDTLNGDAGNDTLAGGPGNDALTGEGGNDVIGGGDGVDLVNYSEHAAGVTVTIGGTGGSIGESDTVGVDVEDIDGTNAADVLTGSAASNEILGRDGNDTIVGLGGVDFLHGGSGSDSIEARDGVGDFVDCGDNDATATAGNDDHAGVDYLDVLMRTTCERVESTTPPATIPRPVPTAGADVLIGTDGNDTFHALNGDDTIWGGAGADSLFGDAGDDVIHAGSGNDVVEGGTGNDVLSGSAGNDTIRGQAGNDTLVGGTGTDVLDGGAGNDVLVLRDGRRGDRGNCGAGKDVAVIDRGDRPSRCEKVLLG